jgi:hypothetical protein
MIGMLAHNATPVLRLTLEITPEQGKSLPADSPNLNGLRDDTGNFRDLNPLLYKAYRKARF